MTINFEDFQKLEIKIGKVLSAESVEGADKLLKLEVDFGNEKRQIVAGLKIYYEPEDFIGKSFPFLVNLEPRKLKGVESQGMILVADANEKPVMLVPEEDVLPGTEVG